MIPRRIWLGIGGVIAGAALALALGVSLEILLVMAAVLVCPVVMSLGMHATGGPQDARPDNGHHTAVVPEPQHTLDAAAANAKR